MCARACLFLNIITFSTFSHYFSPEDVPNMGAGDNLKGAATHPGLEAQLEVLGSPDVEARVVGAQPLKELRGIRYLGIVQVVLPHISVNGEESASHGGAVSRFPSVGSSLSLVLRQGVPVELGNSGCSEGSLRIKCQLN